MSWSGAFAPARNNRGSRQPRFETTAVRDADGVSAYCKTSGLLEIANATRLLFHESVALRHPLVLLELKTAK
ncbi:hypothetical protein CV102_11270 [Natronococcus pandeyae]|uniref:Uncharacterized protein n=1 Tax=Natronococcus pandeyae TaxID=2055836 RepID=A0A8J8Q348_9EURY|nr:hypothetical protein CV102_11270 [Natronococcus pandeyae]